MSAIPQQRGQGWAHTSPFTLRPHPRNAGPSLPLHLAGKMRTGQTGQCAGQVHHTALGTQGRGTTGGAQPSSSPTPLLVSSVPLCSQRPKHLAEEGAVEGRGFRLQGKGLWRGGASSCMGSLWPESERQY